MRCRALVLRAWPLLTAMSLAAIPILTGSALAEDTIVRVEEDWELVVATPDAASDAPQVTCTISPTGNLDGIHAVLELNQQSLPAYVPPAPGVERRDAVDGAKVSKRGRHGHGRRNGPLDPDHAIGRRQPGI